MRVIELLAIGIALAYNVYVNASQVPGLKDAVANIKTDIAVLQTNYANIQNSLDRIEDKLK